jgi:hypothetical protein
VLIVLFWVLLRLGFFYRAFLFALFFFFFRLVVVA